MGAVLTTPERDKTMKINKLLLTAVFAAIAVPALAQTGTPKLDAREAKQQERIANGAANGQLTAKETQNLEKHEAKLNADEAAAKSDGVVTAKEHRQLKREANRDSRRIARKKHNEKVQ
jgi:hypothetical protein